MSEMLARLILLIGDCPTCRHDRGALCLHPESRDVMESEVKPCIGWAPIQPVED